MYLYGWVGIVLSCYQSACGKIRPCATENFFFKDPLRRLIKVANLPLQPQLQNRLQTVVEVFKFIDQL